MALSRYSVLPDQKIVNTHVDQDLSLVNRVLATKQQAYNEAEAFDQQQEGVFGKYAVRNVDIARRDELHNDYVQKAQALVQDQYQGDYSQALPALKKLANGYAGNEFWNRASTALSRQKDMYETEKTIQKKGGTSLAFNRDAANKAIYDPATGEYSDVDFDVQERSDWTKPKLELMKDIAKDTRLTGLSSAQIAGVLQHGSMKGVSSEKVLGVAQQMLQPYLSTPEGAQEMKFYVHQGYSPKQAMEQMLKSLGGIGSKQVGMDRDMDYMAQPGFGDKGKKEDEESAPEFGFLPLGLNPHALPGAEWSEDGTRVTSLPKKYSGISGLVNAFEKRSENETGLPIGHLIGAAKDVLSTGKDAPTPKQKAQLASLGAAAKRNGITPQKMAEAIKDVNVQVQYFTDKKQRENESERFYNKTLSSGEFTTRKLYTDEFPDGALAKDVIPEWDKKDGRGGFTVIGTTGADNPYTPKGKVVQYETADGPKTFIMDDAPNANALESFAHNQNLAKYSGQHTFKSRITTTKGGRPSIGKQEHTYRSTAVLAPDGSITTELELVN